MIRTMVIALLCAAAAHGASLVENAQAVKTASDAIDAAIAAKGGTTAGGLNNAAAAIAALPSGADPDAFVPPESWIDVRPILKADTEQYTHKLIALFPPQTASIRLGGAEKYRTSDGETYTSSTTNSFSRAGQNWVIYYSSTIISIPKDRISEMLWIYGEGDSYLVITGEYRSFSTGIVSIDCNGEGGIGYNNYSLRYVRSEFKHKDTNNPFYQNYSLEHCPTNIVESHNSIFYCCYSLRHSPKVLKMTSSATSGFYSGCYNVSDYPRILTINATVSFADAARVTDRDSFAVLTGGVCTDTHENPSLDYGMVNNLNATAKSGATLTVHANTRAMFTATEWAAISACLSAKGWALSPAE